MLNQILDLSKQLISIPSTKENPEELTKVLSIAEKALGEGFTFDRFEKKGVPSLLIHTQKSKTKKFKIILNAHLDVVPGKDEQYRPYEKDGKLFGRGSSDMKSAGAVEILVFKELAKKVKYPLALQLVTDEEIGGFNAAKHQLDEGIRADFTIAGEPTNFGINNEAKGIVWAKIYTKGTTGHGAYPWNGVNAIWNMHTILNKIHTQFAVPEKEAWKTTINLASISTSNVTFNKIPDACTALIDVRYIPQESDTIVKTLTDLVGNIGTIELVTKEPSQFTDKKNKYLLAVAKNVEKFTSQTAKIIVKHGGADIRHFNAVGCDGITFGPLSAGLHSDDEWVDIKSLKTYYQILKEFLLELE